MRRAVLGVLGLVAIAVALIVAVAHFAGQPAFDRTVYLRPGQYHWVELPMESGGTIRVTIEPRHGAAVTFVMLRGEESWQRYRGNVEAHGGATALLGENWARDIVAMFAHQDFRYLTDYSRIQYPHRFDSERLRVEPDRYVLVLDNTTFGGGGKDAIEAQVRIWTGGGG